MNTAESLQHYVQAHVYLIELKNLQWNFEQLQYFVQSPVLKSDINLG